MLGEMALIFLGAVIGWATTLYASRLSEKLNLIGDHIMDLMNYSEELRLHWCKSYVDDSKSHIEDIAKIKTLYISIKSFYDYHAPDIFGKKMLSVYEELTLKLLIMTTEDDFENVGRDINELRAYEAMEITWKLIQILRRERREQYRLVEVSRFLVRGLVRRDRKD